MTSAGCLQYRALVAALLTWSGGVAGAQSEELRGRVVTETGTPIPGATVTLGAIRYTVRADSLGRFVLTGTPGGTLELSIAADGFRAEAVSVVLPRGRPVSRDFVLVTGEAEPVEAEPFALLRGTVRSMDGEPLAYANIQLNGGRRVISSDSGHFALPLTTRGRLTVLARRIGYEATELVLDGPVDTLVTLRLQPLAASLPEMRVTARSPFVSLDLHGFYKRMADREKGANSGYFVTPEELEMRNPVNVTDAVEQFPNIRLRPGNAEYTIDPVSGYVHPLNVPRNMVIQDRTGCPLTVYLDGIRIQPSMRAVGNGYKGDTRFKGDLQDEQVNALVNPRSVAGIEVYPRGLSAPPEYQSIAGTCGVVLIWSR